MTLTREARCESHKRKRNKIGEASRPSAAKRGYGSRWREARRAWLAKHPLCVLCGESGRTVAASVVDHVVPHRGDRQLFWDSSNWQSLCEKCHNRKTARGS